MPKRYPPEVRAKAVQLALDHLDEYGSVHAAARAIGPIVEVRPETLRMWIVKAVEQQQASDGSAADELAPIERGGLSRLPNENREPAQATRKVELADGPTSVKKSKPEQRKSATRRRLLTAELVIGAIGSAAVAATGVSGLPAWAIVLFSVGLTAATASATSAAVGPRSDRVLSLWIAVGLLAALLAGTLIYVNASGPVPFVNYVNDQPVVLSPVAGTHPRTDPEAPVLDPGEEHSAYCYVVVKGATWLFFKGNIQDGWAPLADFHLPPEAHNKLPGPC